MKLRSIYRNNMKKIKLKTETSAHIINLGKKMYCPKCGWESQDYGNGARFTSSIDGIKGDWCLKCLVKKAVKGIPMLIEIKNK